MNIGHAVAPGVFRWTAFHEEWGHDVGCVALADGAVLVDPLVPDDPAEDPGLAAILAAPKAIVLTVFFHRRSVDAIRERMPDVPVWAPQGSELDDLAFRAFRAGDELPGRIVALGTARPDEVVLWHPTSGSLIPGDVLLGDDAGGGIRLCPDSWLPDGVDQADLARSLRPILDLPVERVLVSHGDPVLSGARSALSAAIGR